VHQQVNPLVLTHGQTRDRQVEPPDVAVAVQFGEVAVVDAEALRRPVPGFCGRMACFLSSFITFLRDWIFSAMA
jgi:hypothetical protein